MTWTCTEFDVRSLFLSILNKNELILIIYYIYIKFHIYILYEQMDSYTYIY